jgi:hypothetical protein
MLRRVIGEVGVEVLVVVKLWVGVVTPSRVQWHPGLQTRESNGLIHSVVFCAKVCY